MLFQGGIRCGFILPVIGPGQPLALLSLLSSTPREEDSFFMEAMPGLGSLLARLIERKLAQKTLEQSRQKLEDILCSLRDVVYSCSPTTFDPYYLNPAVERITGHPARDFYQDQKLWLKIVHPDDRQRVIDSLPMLMQQGSVEMEYRIVCPDGETRIVNNAANLIRDPDGQPQRIDGMVTDLTERRRAETQLTHLQQHDGLTGLPNRNLFRDRLTQAIARSHRNQTTLSIILVGIDRLKDIYENLGYDKGDALIQQAALRITGCVRTADTVARLESDEFIVLLEDLPDAAGTPAVAAKLLDILSLPYYITSKEIFLNFSMGLDSHPPGPGTPDALSRRAEIAMWHARREGGNCWHAYTSEIDARDDQRMELETHLRHAIERHEFYLCYQPKIDARSATVTGVEALLRWNNPVLGEVSPARFIPIAEETGLILSIGEWVMHEACQQARAWHDRGFPLSVAINLSPRQFRQTDLAEKVAAILAETGLDPHHLELEITEGAAMTHPEQAISILQRLRRLNVDLSVDDFGTGYSSLAYLKRFPLNKLKIDKSFVKNLHAEPENASIVQSIIALAHSLGLKTIAEGIETLQEKDFLQKLGCDQYQGYLFSKPLAADKVFAFLQKSASHASHSGSVLHA